MADEPEPFEWEKDDKDHEKEADALRKERDRVGKKLRDAEKEIDRLKPFETKVVTGERDIKLTAVFKEAGVSEKQVKIFTALNPEVDPATVTKESVVKFAQDNDLTITPPEAEGEGEAAGSEGDGFTPVATPPGAVTQKGVLSSDDWLKLAGTDPAAAEAAFKPGKDHLG